MEIRTVNAIHDGDAEIAILIPVNKYESDCDVCEHRSETSDEPTRTGDFFLHPLTDNFPAAHVCSHEHAIRWINEHQ